MSEAKMVVKPLELDWHQILKEENAPSLELEVVPTRPPPLASAPVPASSSSSPLEQSLTDSQLEEKLTRMKANVRSGFFKNLADKGQKYLANIQALQEESDRRKMLPMQKGNIFLRDTGETSSPDKCKTTTESSTAEFNGAPRNSALTTLGSDSEASFSVLFNKQLTERAGSMSMDKICSNNPKQMHEGTHFCNVSSQSARLSSRKALFTPAIKLASTGKRRSANTNCFKINTSKFYSLRMKGRFSKRLKESEWGDTLKSKKIQKVVLLDDEDVQSKDFSKYDSDARPEVKMYYPSRDDPQFVELSYSDMKCLEPEQYISSPIMNFYIRYLQRPPSLVNTAICEYYFFNTYFYGKLEVAVSSLKCDRSLKFSKLRRWWKGVNIFEKAYIFLPIHKDSHWSLVIISIPPEEDQSCPIILHLDSLGMHNSVQILQVIQCYLKEEWKHVNPNSQKLLIDKQQIKVPQQENVYDCGLFVLYFMERFIREAPPRLERKDLGMFGSKWFQPEDASGLRKRLKDLLLEEFENCRLECGKDEFQESLSSSSESDEEPDVQP